MSLMLLCLLVSPDAEDDAEPEEELRIDLGLSRPPLAKMSWFRTWRLTVGLGGASAKAFL